MRVFLDMDGVLVNTIQGISDFHRIGNPYTYGVESVWDLTETMGIPEKELWSPLGYDFWKNLKPYPWMEELVHYLERHFLAENICLLTTPCKTRGCADGKIAWIEKYLPSYTKKYLLGDSKEFCASPESLLIDDNNNNISNFKFAHGRAFLFAAPWNRKHWVIDPLQELKDNLFKYLYFSEKHLKNNK